MMPTSSALTETIPPSVYGSMMGSVDQEETKGAGDPNYSVHFSDGAARLDLLSNFKLMLRAELNAFGSRMGLPHGGNSSSSAGHVLSGMFTPSKNRVSRHKNRKHSGISGFNSEPERGVAAMVSDQPHAWVSRSIRSYAAAAELNQMEDLKMMKSDASTFRDSPESKLLGDKVPKGSGPFSRAQRAKGGKDVGANFPDYSAQDSSPMAHISSIQSAPVRHLAQHLSGKMMRSRDAWGDLQGTENPPLCSRGESRNGTFTSDISAPTGLVPTMPPILLPQEIPQTDRDDDPIAVDQQPASLNQLNSFRHVAEGPEGAEDSSNDGDVRRQAEGFRNGRSQSSLGPKDSVSSTGPAFLMRMSTIYSVVSTAWKSHSASHGAKPWSRARMFAFQLARNMIFENLTVVFILANACTIGIQTDYCARNVTDDTSGPIDVINRVIAAFFLCELVLRVFAYRRNFFTMQSWRWNILDFCVVGLQVLEEVVSFLNLTQSNFPAALSLMRMVRILRLVRVIRIVRLLRYMSELRTIVVSITGSMKPLISTIVLLALVVYVVGIYFTQLTVDYRIEHKFDEQQVEEFEHFFGSVGSTVMSLFQTVTGGLEWRIMVDPLVTHISPVMGVVFAFYIVFTSMALMNIVTGVFVETALQRGREDKDVYMINHLKDLFGVLDENHNGTISWSELEEHLGDPKLIAFFKDIDIDITEARGLFHLLDRDGSGNIDADEFMSGALRLRGPAKALDLQLVMLELADQRRSVQRLLATYDRVCEDSEAE